MRSRPGSRSLQPLRRDLARFHARLRAGGLATAIDGLTETRERTADTVALLLRAGLLELPAGGLAPVLRELASVLAERLEARERAHSRASTLQLEAAILALSPIILFLLVGLASGADFPNACRLSNHAAGIVIREVGTASCTREQLLASLAETRT